MSHVTPATLEISGTESGPPTAASTLRKHAPVLITENQVAFSTAAAAPVGSTRRRWLDTTLMGGLGRILTALTKPRPRYPRREHAYFEAARMSRAMDRL
ncbi:MAG: hypothetical protein QOG19_2090 [Mycobacterium sp.]|nr:hypothetical protein [Mycobacterium sp.]MDT5224683.1 hypothetical protein [Mycobacterium sp.]